VLGEERTLEADSCSADPTSLQVMSSRAWGEIFFVFLRISFRVVRIEAALRRKEIEIKLWSVRTGWESLALSWVAVGGCGEQGGFCFDFHMWGRWRRGGSGHLS